MNPEESAALHQAVVAVCSDIDGSGWHPNVWNALEQMGVTALSVAEAAGGAGADLPAATTVLIALGLAGASVPFVESDLVAGYLIEQAGLRMPQGAVTAAIACDYELRRVRDGWLLSGVAPKVPWGRHSDWVVAVTKGADPHVVVLPTNGAEIRRGSNIAGEPRDDLVFVDRLLLPEEVRPVGEDAVGHALRCGAFGRSAQMTGAAQSVYQQTVKYAGERHQFGRPLSAMPVVQQMLAELAEDVCSMTVAVEAAAGAAATRPQDAWVLDAARVRVATSAAAVAAIGHQIHGAIGFTQEHPLHRATTRLWAWREEYGNAKTWSNHLGEELAGGGGDWPLWHRLAL